MIKGISFPQIRFMLLSPLHLGVLIGLHRLLGKDLTGKLAHVTCAHNALALGEDIAIPAGSRNTTACLEPLRATLFTLYDPVASCHYFLFNFAFSSRSL